VTDTSNPWTYGKNGGRFSERSSINIDNRFKRLRANQNEEIDIQNSMPIQRNPSPNNIFNNPNGVKNKFLTVPTQNLPLSNSNDNLMLSCLNDISNKTNSQTSDIFSNVKTPNFNFADTDKNVDNNIFSESCINNINMRNRGKNKQIKSKESKTNKHE